LRFQAGDDTLYAQPVKETAQEAGLLHTDVAAFFSLFQRGSDTMAGDLFNVLLIEDNPGDARLFEEYLVHAKFPKFTVQHYDRLSTGLARAVVGDVDVVLLDLNLPDSQGIDTVVGARAALPDVPIVVLTGIQDQDVAVRAVQEGAQGLLFKNRVDDKSLKQSIQYAIQRHRIQHDIREARKDYDTKKCVAVGAAAAPLMPFLDAFSFGQKTLREEDARKFSGHFDRILASLTEHRTGDPLAAFSYQLRSLAHELAKVNAGPRDVLEIALNALHARLAHNEIHDRNMEHERGTQAVVGLMAHLAAFYQHRQGLPGGQTPGTHQT
jgi:DNA-binding NarL/FixJ family response regulator